MATAALCLLACDEEVKPVPPPAAATAPAKSAEREPVTPPPPAAPQPALKIAIVDMARAFKESPRTRALEKEQQADLAKVQQENDRRLERIRAINTELDTLRKTLDDPTISDMRKQAAVTERNAKLQDGVALDRERREFLQRREQALRERAIQRARGLFEEIRLIVKETAREEGYDFVFDRSAESVNQTPFLLDCRDSTTDLTDGVIAQLQRDDSSSAKSDAGPEPATPLDMHDR